MTVLTEGRRATTTLVEIDGIPAIRKEFRPGFKRHKDRELFARTELSPLFPEIPPVLEHGALHVTSPFYHDTLSFSRSDLHLFPLSVARQAVDFLEKLFDAGFAMLDAHPENLLVEPEGQLRFFDFEFLHAYGPDKPESFLESWDLLGPPEAWRGDQPVGGCPTWQSHWYGYVGLTVPELRHARTSTQHRKRMAHWTRRLLPARIDKQLSPKGIEVKHRLANFIRRNRT